jgi:hypothetical protein
MRCLRLIFLALILLSLGVESRVLTVRADPSDTSTVTVTFTSAIPFYPSGFTATMTGLTTVELEWTKGANATWTQIRAKMGSYPENVTDGYIVYNGTAENFTDTSVNFDIMLDGMFYIAFGGNDTYTDPTFAQDAAGEDIMSAFTSAVQAITTDILTLAGAFFAVIFFSVMAFWLAQTSKWSAPIFMLAGGASLFCGLYFYNIVPSYLGLAVSFLLIGYTLVCLGLAFKVLTAKPYYYYYEDDE